MFVAAEQNVSTAILWKTLQMMITRILERFNGEDLNDSSRIMITKDIHDLGKFKTPGLRNVAVTAPYMHNGMFATLEDVIEYYNEPSKFVSNSINTDKALLKPLGLKTQEKKRPRCLS